MTRPTSVKPDNFFLLLFHALRQRRVPIALRIAVHSLLLVATALVIYACVMGLQFKQAMQQQADALGQSLTTQTAQSATELLVSNDILSLNVLLNNLTKNPLVAHAAIYSVDNRILAESGTRPKQGLLGDAEGLYSTPITFQEVIAGHLRISLDMHQFEQPMTVSLQSMGLISLILLLLTLTFGLRLGRQISTPLLQLRVWLRDPDDSAPGAGLQNEIGDLARQLQARLAPEKPPAPEPVVSAPAPRAKAPAKNAAKEPLLEKAGTADEHEFDENIFSDEELLTPAARRKADADDDFPEEEFEAVVEEEAEDEIGVEEEPEAEPEPVSAGTSAVLAVQLGAQEQLRRLPRARLVDLLERYRDCLEQAARLYKGTLYTLSDGGSLILFHSRDQDEEFLTNALCCGELMRALGHALQIEVADSGITLQLQLGLVLGEDVADLEQAELLQDSAAQDALALSQHSRNLLLVEKTIGDDEKVRERARIRPIASPENACCVEWLKEPYPSMLERQLSRMRALRTT
ncbi:AhpA/YtjB family protein [Pseudomonas sp. NY15435]|uniref:AhpA/YtjB family protein n=1 Tax=Pseudomonas sp. NY15435 TaxID=3400358 RepID=UPI003A8872AB